MTNNEVKSEIQEISFEAIAFKQGIGDLFTAHIPVALLPFIEVLEYPKELEAEEKSQRELDIKHANGIAEYVVTDLNRYILSALTASIVPPSGQEEPDAITFKFEPFFEGSRSGKLTLMPGVKLLFNDGQHRRYGLKKALEQEYSLAEHGIAVTLIPEYTLEKCQYAFLKINSNQKPIQKGIKLVYDHQNPKAKFLSDLLKRTPILLTFTDRAKTSLSGNNPKMFSLSHLHKIVDIIRDQRTANYEQELEFVSRFFITLTDILPLWQKMLDRTSDAKEVRDFYITTQGVVLEALAGIAARIKGRFLGENIDQLFKFLSPLGEIDWCKANPDWDNRILASSIVTDKKGQSKTVYKMRTKTDDITRMVTYLKVCLKMPLTPHEQALEEAKDPYFMAKVPLELKPSGEQTVLPLEVTEVASNQESSGAAQTTTPTPKGQRTTSTKTGSKTSSKTGSKAGASKTGASKRGASKIGKPAVDGNFIDGEEVKVIGVSKGTGTVPKKFTVQPEDKEEDSEIAS